MGLMDFLQLFSGIIPGILNFFLGQQDIERIESENAASLERTREGIGIIEGGNEQLTPDSLLSGSPFAGDFAGSSLAGIFGNQDVNQFQSFLGDRNLTNPDDFRIDLSGIQGLSDSIGTAFAEGNIDPGTLFNQVDFPEFNATERLGERVGGIEAASRVRQNQARTQAIGRGLGRGETLESISGSTLPSLQFAGDQSRALQGQEARSSIEDLGERHDLSRANLQGGLAGIEEQINAALLTAAQRERSSLGAAGLNAETINLDSLLRGGQRNDQLSSLDAQFLASLVGGNQRGNADLAQFFANSQQGVRNLGTTLANDNRFGQANLLAGHQATIPSRQSFLGQPINQAFGGLTDFLTQEQIRRMLEDQQGGGSFGFTLPNAVPFLGGGGLQVG